MPYVRTIHVQTPVYLDIRETITSTQTPIDITRSDIGTVVSVLKNSDPAWAVQEIAQQLHPAHEYAAWIHPWADTHIDLRRLRREPLRCLASLNPWLIRVPCQTHYVPQKLRTPWHQP